MSLIIIIFNSTDSNKKNKNKSVFKKYSLEKQPLCVHVKGDKYKSTLMRQRKKKTKPTKW